jgi:predicted dehydrogenase
VVAISTRDAKKRAGDWTSIQGNFGPRGEQMDLTGVAAYEKFEELLADPNVNLVDLCVPNADHAPMAIAALKAGKDVLVEKPIALSLEDAEAMVATARETGRKLMVARLLANSLMPLRRLRQGNMAKCWQRISIG